jgi:hypothetical protein
MCVKCPIASEPQHCLLLDPVQVAEALAKVAVISELETNVKGLGDLNAKVGPGNTHGASAASAVPCLRLHTSCPTTSAAHTPVYGMAITLACR